MNHVVFVAPTVADTERLGTALAELLPAGAVVALIGTLGSGKTRLVQAVARACGVPDGEVRSPTFVLIGQYAGWRTIVHFDVYRLRDGDEFEQLGPDEYFDAGDLTFVEWADRVEAHLPEDRFEIRLQVAGPTSRTFHISSPTLANRVVLERLRERLSR